MQYAAFIIVWLCIAGFGQQSANLDTKKYKYIPDFEMGEPGTPLDDPNNWEEVPNLTHCVNGAYLCSVVITNVGSFTELPSKQVIINQVKAAYIPATPFTHGDLVDIFGTGGVKVAEATVYRHP